DDPRAGDAAVFTFRCEFEACGGGDARERLATKPEGRDPFDVPHTVDLARGVAFDCERRVGFGHSVTVVRDADRIETGIFDCDFDRSCARVERVLDQFGDDARGPRDDLARGDAFDSSSVEFSDLRHRVVVRAYRGGRAPRQA